MAERLYFLGVRDGVQGLFRMDADGAIERVATPDRIDPESLRPLDPSVGDGRAFLGSHPSHGLVFLKLNDSGALELLRDAFGDVVFPGEIGASTFLGGVYFDRRINNKESVWSWDGGDGLVEIPGSRFDTVREIQQPQGALLPVRIRDFREDADLVAVDGAGRIVDAPASDATSIVRGAYFLAGDQVYWTTQGVADDPADLPSFGSTSFRVRHLQSDGGDAVVLAGQALGALDGRLLVDAGGAYVWLEGSDASVVAIADAAIGDFIGFADSRALFVDDGVVVSAFGADGVVTAVADLSMAASTTDPILRIAQAFEGDAGVYLVGETESGAVSAHLLADDELTLVSELPTITFGRQFDTTGAVVGLADTRDAGVYSEDRDRPDLANFYTGGDTADMIVAGAGDDVVYAGSGADIVLGGGDIDWILGGDGDDLVEGGDGDDYIEGGNGDRGDDRLSGGAGDDIIYGGGSIFGGDDDVIYGGAGDDHLSGGLGDSVLIGGAGDDFLDGKNGVDVMVGGDGDDHMRAQGGSDVLRGGAGNDYYASGAGADYIFVQSGHDRVADFEPWRDILDLSAYGFRDFAELQGSIDVVPYSGPRITAPDGESSVTFMGLAVGAFIEDGVIL